MIQDERARKYVCQVKGATGIKPCMLCKNVVCPRSDLLPDPTGWLVPAHCVDTSRFDLYTNEEIHGMQRRLRDAAARGEMSELKRLEILYGWCYQEDGILQDPHLQLPLADALAWDWMHCYMVGGLFERE
eukprot:7648185-Pyramimonas_sp.AAC.1